MHTHPIDLTHAAGETNPGLRRDVNEDRFHVDRARGVFFVVDGMGGQAAGGKAADIAVEMLRTRLERQTGPVELRVREAIVAANNEIYRTASQRAEWHGMACVLTVVVVEGDRAIVGHVGDTRLYLLRQGRIEKITRDHSPVGEREDAHELTESEAMTHPRRNEVYRDVGSEPHEPADADFVDIQEITLEPAEALLICSDGLTDLVDSASIARIVCDAAGDPGRVTRALIEAANAAGGSDNITVVYIGGDPSAGWSRPSPSGNVSGSGVRRSPKLARALRVPSMVVLAAAAGLVAGWWVGRGRVPLEVPAAIGVSIGLNELIVQSSGSIAETVAAARPGATVIVEPGEYREQIVLKDDIRLVSRVPGGAVLRLPASASESDAAVVAQEVERAELTGFRIVGDAATPLGTGILVKNAGLSIVDVDVSGATMAGVDVSGARDASLIGSLIHENPGAGLVVRADSTPRIARNSFVRNGLSDATRAVVVEPGAHPRMSGNVFHGIGMEVFAGLDPEMRQALKDGNFFPAPPAAPRHAGRVP